MQFEWDPKKATINLRAHKVSFEEAATALEDELSLTGDDPDHSIVEARQITFGNSKRRSSADRFAHGERRTHPYHQRPSCHSSGEEAI
jgi:uncharacterized DUF497 family protein